MERRLQEIAEYLTKSFELNVNGVLGDSEFIDITKGYSEEKQRIEQEIKQSEDELEELKNSSANKERFISTIDSITDFSELTPEILNSLIDRIVVHEKSIPKARKNYTQEIEIFFKFIGKLC